MHSEEHSESTKQVIVWIEADRKKQQIPTRHVLNQFDIRFVPHFLVIQQGDTVSVENADPVYHNVFSMSSVKSFSIGRRPKGQKVEVVFPEPGAVPIFCDIHSSMSAEIVVLPHSAIFSRLLEPPYSFEFDQLNPGSYTLVAYASGLIEQRISFSIPEQTNNELFIQLRTK